MEIVQAIVLFKTVCPTLKFKFNWCTHLCVIGVDVIHDVDKYIMGNVV